MLKHRKVVGLLQTQTLLYTSRWRCPKQPHNLRYQTSYIGTMVKPSLQNFLKKNSSERRQLTVLTNNNA